MAGDFWRSISKLYRQMQQDGIQQSPQNQTPIQQNAPAIQQQQTPSGPPSYDTILATIAQAGRARRLLEITYNDVPRLVEPYSMRNRKKSRLNKLTMQFEEVDVGNIQFYGYCFRDNRINSFIPSKIQAIRITEHTFSPREGWAVEF